MQERDRIQKARETLMKIAHGADPITGEIIPEESFMNDPGIIRCFYFISDILDNVVKGVYSSKNHMPFSITPEQISRIELPEGKIGVNEFSRCVNEVLDINGKKLTGVELNKRLKQNGVLSETTNEEGKIVTTTNPNSCQYGFETEHRSKNGREFEMILINAAGKKYLLDNIEKLICMETPA